MEGNSYFILLTPSWAEHTNVFGASTRTLHQASPIGQPESPKYGRYMYLILTRPECGEIFVKY
jgi:hypothetical protein